MNRVRRRRKQGVKEEIRLDGDSSLRSREVLVNSHRQILSVPISPKKRKVTPWTDRKGWEPEDHLDFALDPTSEWYDRTVQGGIYEAREWEDVGTLVTSNVEESNQAAPAKPASKKLKRTLCSRRPHQYWRLYSQDSFLDELLRQDGRGDMRSNKVCSECWYKRTEPAGEPRFRCLDCFGGDMVCRLCCVRRHRCNPFHRVEEWQKDRFLPRSLKSLGVAIHLNHQSICTNPVRCHQSFRVLHINGIHDVSLNFCGCEDKVDQHIQLLRRSLYPATEGKNRIKTVVTFAYLEHLHHVMMASKATAYDMCKALCKATDATGLTTPPWRYRALMRMVLQWRHLKLLKCCGRGHDPSGVAGTVEGELVVPCPSCPRPGVNLPDGWQSDTDNADLYALRLAQDANFRLSEQLVSSHSRDPGLNDGKGYFVTREPYEEYVVSLASDEDINNCVGFQAIIQAHTRFSKGLRYTGVGAVGCARGEMWLPNGVGSLQKGERYGNMDYPFASVVRHFKGILLCIIGYDIACQWFINLLTRMANQWPAQLVPPSNVSFIPVIGKFHEPCHKTKNHQQFSSNLIKWMGMSDWELMERLWSIHNALSNSTKAMGPGTRIDTLEAHFGCHNWDKYVGHGSTLWSKYKQAVQDRNRQREAHEGFTKSIGRESVKSQAMVDDWEGICIAWENAAHPKAGVLNPFEVEDEVMKEGDVEKELEAEDAARLRDSQQVPLHKSSPVRFIRDSLDVEDEQYKLQGELEAFKKSLQTAKQAGTLRDRRNIVSRNIHGVEELRAIYMPGLLQLLTDKGVNSSHNPDDNPEDASLWLPSAIDEKDRDWVCYKGLADVEACLRRARCFDALHSIRHTLRVKARMVQFKNANVRGQRDSGRSREVIDGVHNRAKSFADKYRRNRKALLALIGPGSWEQELRILENSDVRGYRDLESMKVGAGRRGTNEEAPGREGDTVEEIVPAGSQDRLDLLPEVRGRRQGTGESRDKLSWIWWTATVPVSVKDGADPDNELLRLEWCKSRARFARAREELRYVKEDMRRTVEFLNWKEIWWKQRRLWRSNVPAELQEGLQAYAVKQERIQHGLHTKFIAIWKRPLENKELEEDVEDHRLRMDLGLASPRDEAEFLRDGDEEEDAESDEGETDMGNDTGLDFGIDMDDEDLGWG